MTPIRRAIRDLTQNASPFSCRVWVESVEQVSTSFVRVTVSGDGLDEYRDVMPADGFKLMLPPHGAGAVDFPERGSDGVPCWPEGHVSRCCAGLLCVTSIRSGCGWSLMWRYTPTG